MRFHALVPLASLTLILPAFAQKPMHREWLRHENGSGHSDDFGYFTAVDAQGRACMTGTATNADGLLEVLTVLYDATGHKLWSQSYIGNGGGGDYGSHVAYSPDGTVLVAGESVGSGTDYDLLLLKYDMAGNLIWERRYDGPASGYDGLAGARTLAVDDNGDIMLAGHSTGIGTSYDLVILRYSEDGNLLWSDRINGSANGVDTAFALRIDDQHNILIGGGTTNTVTGRDILILKYDAAGNRLWEQQYAGPGAAFDFVWAGELDAAGNLIVCGVTGGVGSGDDAIVQKYDTNGNLLWSRTFNGANNGHDGAFGMSVSDQGSVAMTGYVRKSYEDLTFTQLYDAGGTLLWTREFGVSPLYLGTDFGTDCEIDSAGNVNVVGIGWNGPSSGYDTYLLRYSPQGDVNLLDVCDGPVHGDEWGLSLTLNDDGERFLTGYTQRGEQHQDALLIKYGTKDPIMDEGFDGSSPTLAPPLNARGRGIRLAPGASPQPFRPRPVQFLPLPMRRSE